MASTGLVCHVCKAPCEGECTPAGSVFHPLPVVMGPDGFPRCEDHRRKPTRCDAEKRVLVVCDGSSLSCPCSRCSKDGVPIVQTPFWCGELVEEQDRSGARRVRVIPCGAVGERIVRCSGWAVDCPCDSCSTWRRNALAESVQSGRVVEATLAESERARWILDWTLGWNSGAGFGTGDYRAVFGSFTFRGYCPRHKKRWTYDPVKDWFTSCCGPEQSKEPPGPQFGRKEMARFEAFAMSAGMRRGLFTEEYGKSTDRLHYHSGMAFSHGLEWDRLWKLLNWSWRAGSSRIELALSEEQATGYVVKYVVKDLENGHGRDLASWFDYRDALARCGCPRRGDEQVHWEDCPGHYLADVEKRWAGMKSFAGALERPELDLGMDLPARVRKSKMRRRKSSKTNRRRKRGQQRYVGDSGQGRHPSALVSRAERRRVVEALSTRNLMELAPHERMLGVPRAR